MSDPVNHLALVLLDLQEPFLNAVHEPEALRRRTAFAAEAASLLGCHIAYTEQSPEKLGPTEDALARHLPESAARFPKSGFSAFRAEGFAEWLRANEIDHILLAGLETGICVYQTAVDAMGEETGVTLLADCVGQRRPADRDPVLRQLAAMGAHILPSETVFYSLLGGAEHPAFRDFTRLVKNYAF